LLNYRVQERFAHVSVVSERFDDVVLALEISIDCTVAHARTPHDVGHAGLMESILGETGECGIENLLPTGFALQITDFGQRSPHQKNRSIGLFNLGNPTRQDAALLCAGGARYSAEPQ
jgi:hypothetical protein